MTPTNATVLSKLPLDLLQDVVSQMTARDVMNLKAAYQYECGFEAVIYECKNRLSVLRYLDKNLGNGAEWLEAMSRSRCYISGSRSLEFFVPGSINESSDWDIYVSRSANVEAFLARTEELGVRWLSHLERIEKLLESGDGELVVDASALNKIARSGELIRLAVSKGCTTGTNTFRRANGMSVLELNNKVLRERLPRSSNAYCSPRIKGLRQGELTRCGKTIQIQLIHEYREPGMIGIDSVFNFHSSCVQSFLGPHSACHLYGELAAQKKSYGWYDNTRKKPTRMFLEESGLTVKTKGQYPEEWMKYKNRGFEYVCIEGVPPRISKQRERSSINKATGESCTLIHYEHNCGAPDAVVQMYRRVVESIEWTDFKRTGPSSCGGARVNHASDAILGLGWFSDSYDIQKRRDSILIDVRERIAGADDRPFL